MAYSEIIFTFSQDIPVSSQIGFSYYTYGNPFGVPYSGYYVWNFVTTRSAGMQITAGTPTGLVGEISAINFVSAFTLDVGWAITRVGNQVTIRVENGAFGSTEFYWSQTISTWDYLNGGMVVVCTNHPGISAVINNLVTDPVISPTGGTGPVAPINISHDDFILANSPYNITYNATASLYDYCTVDLFVWEGSAYTPPTTTEPLTSYKASDSDTEIYLDVSDYIKEKLNPVINVDWVNGTLGEVEACWVRHTLRSYKLQSGVGVLYETVNSDLKVATLGYGYHEDGDNPKPPSDILVDPVEHYGAGTYTYTVSVNTGASHSNGIINRQSYSTTKELCSNGNRLFEIAYLNKYGVFDTLIFSRASKRIINITSEKYQFYQENPNRYKTNIPTSRVQNTNGVEEWTINTDLLDDTQNEYVQQLTLSDRWFLLDYSRNLVVPVIMTDKKYEEKLGYYEKAKIQWTLKFQSANNKINDIR